MKQEPIRAAMPVAARVPAFAMAVAAGLAAANIYYNQPLLEVIEAEMPGRLTPLLPMITQLGYAAGLVFLVPLGDLAERRRLIVVQFLLLALALAGTAVAPGPALLLAASFLVGMLSTAAQQIVPFAATLAPAERRGAVVGQVMSGLLTGILLSRTLSGLVGGVLGWRMTFALAVPLALGAALLMRVRLPASQPQGGPRYGALMRSLTGLWRDYPVLRRLAITQALQFGAFSVFWSVLAFRLAEPRFGLGPEVAGLFGLVGLAGILAAPLAGRFADAGGPYRILQICGGATLLSWAILGLFGSIAGMILGVIVLDFAVQGSLIACQSLVFALAPEARSRLNTLFMAMMFLGGAAGSAGATLAWGLGGWPAVSAVGIACGIGAVAMQLRRR